MAVFSTDNASYKPYLNLVNITYSNVLSLSFVTPTLANLSTSTNNWVYVNVSGGFGEVLDQCWLDVKWSNGTWENISMAVGGHYCYLNVTGIGS